MFRPWRLLPRGVCPIGAPDGGIPDEAIDETVTAIAARAAERARKQAVEYLGLVTPVEAHRLVREAGAQLVDVRSRAERAASGRVPGSIDVAWEGRADGTPTRRFLERLAARVRRDRLALFLAAHGEQSHRAAKAAAEIGFLHACNILEGFDGERVRGRTRGGWRRARLPRVGP